MSNVVGKSSNLTPSIEGNNTANGDGVLGHSDTGIGVEGKSNSGSGVYGKSTNYDGVHGESDSAKNAGVSGINNIGGFGVWGHSTRGTGVFAHSDAGEGVHGETNSDWFAAVAGISLNPTTTPRGVAAGVWGSSKAGEGVHGETNSAVSSAVAGIQLNPASTGAGVYGEHRGNGLAGFFKGDVQVTGDIFLPGADCAEQFDVGSEVIEPGSVVVIGQEGKLNLSQKAYDKKVAGVVSGAGNYRPGIVLDKQQEKDKRLAVALVGKVYCKADAQYSPIEIGDLLTSSPTPGHAMKADDYTRAFGTIIGKALRPLEAGKGLIPILISLQ